MDEAWEFSKKLSSVGMSIPKYKEYYNVANEERWIYKLNYLIHIEDIPTWLTLNLTNTKKPNQHNASVFLVTLLLLGCFQLTTKPNQSTLTIVRKQQQVKGTLIIQLGYQTTLLQEKTWLKIKLLLFKWKITSATIFYNNIARQILLFHTKHSLVILNNCVMQCEKTKISLFITMFPFFYLQQKASWWL